MKASRQLRLSSRRAKLAALAALVAALVSLVSLTGSWSLVDLRAYDYLSILGRPSLPEDGPVIVAVAACGSQS